MNISQKIVYGIIWYVILGAVIFFVHVSFVDIAMLIVGAFLMLAGFKMAWNLKSNDEYYQGQLAVAFFQMVLFAALMVEYFKYNPA